MSCMTHSELMGTAEVATLLGKSRATINRMVEAGELAPAGVVGSRRIRVFDRAEIERLTSEEVRA
ncbi:helix-turn-helix domain-containing protein [Corynebacterium senegalense]|uniref:helix-turn-helix domain-containing protein n=1 Tax=Corynebacterium senegalense TaxID=2080750 RepID=UPI000E1FDDD6